MNSASFVFATYSIDSLRVSIQSPYGEYVNSFIPLIVEASFIYGTTSTIDEFSFHNVICSYRLDDGEWQNITAIDVISNVSQPDINYWNGLLHKLNVTYSTVLGNLSEGLHFINVTVCANDSFGSINASDGVTFSLVKLPSNTSGLSASPFQTESTSPVQSSLPSPLKQTTATPQPQQQPPTEIICTIAFIAIAVTVTAAVAIAKRR
jgi:hypothetical protein